ncbi:unnamed protein product [Toxocara canis]|uniref:Protein sidekick n=1 Tax=Toxocara canis TaxID=6265 RepID=A0A183TZ26_TOXCA|nr:unnamed protein product [Toxocara canis]
MSICWVCVFVWQLLTQLVDCRNVLPGKPPVLSTWDAEKLYLPEGDPLTLRCPAASDGDLSFHWFKDGKPLNEDGTVLHIAHLMPAHSASYRCSAENNFGIVISSPLSIDVLYIYGFNSEGVEKVVKVIAGSAFVLRPPPLNASSHLSLSWTWFFENNEKVVYTLDNSREAPQNDSAKSIYCDSVYKQVAILKSDVELGHGVSVEWKLDRIPLHDDAYVEITHNGRRLSIVSPHLIVQSDNAQVTCVANDESTQQADSVDATLHIIRPPIIDRSRFPREMSKRLGESLKLQCSAVGVPEPSFQWYLSGKPLDVNISTLSITSLDDKDFGVYQCETYNEAGNERSAVDPSAGRSLALAPSIIERPRNASANFGDEVTMLCRAQGDPSPSVTWRHNGSQIFASAKYAVDDRSLSIFSVNQSDSGEYLCVASNENGSDHASAFLSVIGSDLIEYGPTNQSILIGSNILMPCKVSDKYGATGGLLASWKWNVGLPFI